MPLPKNFKPKTGQRLIEDATGQPFTVLCNCSRSRPRNHTRRFIENNPGLYSIPEARYDTARALAALAQHVDALLTSSPSGPSPEAAAARNRLMAKFKENLASAPSQ